MRGVGRAAHVVDVPLLPHSPTEKRACGLLSKKGGVLVSVLCIEGARTLCGRAGARRVCACRGILSFRPDSSGAREDARICVRPAAHSGMRTQEIPPHRDAGRSAPHPPYVSHGLVHQHSPLPEARGFLIEYLPERVLGFLPTWCDRLQRRGYRRRVGSPRGQRAPGSSPFS